MTLQEAGISVKLAPTIGIAVDHRRRNRSLESLQVSPRPPQWHPSSKVLALELAFSCRTGCMLCCLISHRQGASILEAVGSCCQYQHRWGFQYMTSQRIAAGKRC